MNSGTPASSLEATRCQPAYKPTLQEEEKDDDGQDYVDGGGAREPPVLAVGALECQEARRYGFEVFVLDEGDGEEELVPRLDPRDERDGQEAWPAQGQHHAEHDLQLVCAVYAGCVLEVAWKSDEVGAQQQRRQRREDGPVDHDQAKPSVRQVKRTPQEEQRDQEELERDCTGYEQVEQDRVGARQVQPRHRIGARPGDDTHPDDGSNGQDCAVHHGRREVALCPSGREVLEDGRVRQTKGVASYLGVGLERVENENNQRPEGEERQED